MSKCHANRAPHALTRRSFGRTALGALTAAALGCRRQTESAAKDGALPNVVLMVMDTVRAASTSLHGYRRRTTPNCEAFARGAVQFDRAFCTAPWTLASHASMFTGLFPCDHGAEARRRVDGSSGRVEIVETAMHAHVPTLAETLRGLGYRTGGFAANTIYLHAGYGMNRGFDAYVVERAEGEELNRKALRWMRAERGKPFFLFLNYMDAHKPINTRVIPGVVERPFSHDGYLFDRLTETDMIAGIPDPALQAEVTAQYDMGIANADAAVGQVLDALAASGFEDTIAVVTSDHGEYLGEHGYVGHSKDLYQECLHVPLVMRVPASLLGGAPQHGRHTQPASLVNLPAAIAFNVARRIGFDYTAFQRYFEPHGAPILSEIAYSRSWDYANEIIGHRFQRRRTALVEWPWKYIYSSDCNHELYDLEQDPAEQRNLVLAHGDIVQRMHARMLEIKPALEECDDPSEAVKPAVEIDDARREEMEALGYLSKD